MITPHIIKKLVNKAKQTETTYKVAAFAFNKKGEEIGSATCSFRMAGILNKRGCGIHAERKLMAHYGNLIKTIIICRVGHSGDILPISPCKVCQKVADKLGIKILSVSE